MLSIYHLKPAFQTLLRPLVKHIYHCGITANQVTVLAAVISVMTGLLIIGFIQHVWLFALIPVWMILRMAFNAINASNRVSCAGSGVWGNCMTPPISGE